MIEWRLRARPAILAIDPLWDQFAALIPAREEFVATHPWGCTGRRVADRIVFDKLIQVLRFGCSYEGIADTTCSASTLRTRRDEWIRLGLVRETGPLARDGLRPHRRTRTSTYIDRRRVASPKPPAAENAPARSPVDRRKQGLKRSVLVEDYAGIPLGRVRPGGNRHDSPLLGLTLDRLGRSRPAA